MQSLTKSDISKIIFVSVVFDVVQTGLDFIPIFGWIVNICVDFIAWGTFYVMFKRHGVHFNTYKRFLFFNSGFILDFIPFINMFAWTIDVLMVISTVSIEGSQKTNEQ